MKQRSPFAVNVILGITGVALLLPVSMYVAHLSVFGCTTSMEEAGRGFEIWAAASTFIAIAVSIACGFRGRFMVWSLVGQLVLVAFVATALSNLDFGTRDRVLEKRALADMRAIAAGDRKVSNVDPWGNRYLVTGGFIRSRGPCGAHPVILSRGDGEGSRAK